MRKTCTWNTKLNNMKKILVNKLYGVYSEKEGDTMNMQELKSLIYQGEKIDVECKKAEKNVPKSAYESYSAFANTNGGILLLGVYENVAEKDSLMRFTITGWC